MLQLLFPPPAHYEAPTPSHGINAVLGTFVGHTKSFVVNADDKAFRMARAGCISMDVKINQIGFFEIDDALSDRTSRITEEYWAEAKRNTPPRKFKRKR